ncbi:Structural maintenance of chromosomes protein 6 [Apophysomyces sp. BC1021]|nr:Structural maintenance of chromosomes protein 6 [Apophysomyces sp. BC1021]
MSPSAAKRKLSVVNSESPGPSQANAIVPKRIKRDIEDEVEIDTRDETLPVPATVTKLKHKMEVAEAGTISEVEVVNFMCHKRLIVELGPKINFVIGHNGSGKSAILTAITVALGAKASYTNRGKNLSALIREGENVAWVRVRLTNKGPDSFRRDIYGDSIQIERQLLQDGMGGYKIKNHAGKLVSTKREDLVAICDHMSIQVDNPLTMLSQDGARQFLTSSTSHEKYKLFMRGTQLAKLYEDYEVMRESISTMQTIVERKRQYLPDLKRKAKEAAQCYKHFLEIQEIDDTIDTLSNNLVWAQILGKEKWVEELRKNLELEEQSMENIEETIRETTNQVGGCKEHIIKLQASLKEYMHQSEPHRQKRQKLMQDRSAIELKIKNIQTELSETNGNIKQQSLRKEKYEEDIEAEQRRIASNKQGEVVSEITQLKNQKKERVERVTYIDQELEDLESTRSHTTEERTRKAVSCEQAAKITRSLQRNLENLRSHSTDTLKVYGANLPTVLRDIQSESGWKMAKPVGPFGKFIHVERPEFAEVLEKLLSNMMRAFVVECFEDRTLLLRILERRQMSRTPVVVAKRDIFDYSHAEPDSQYLTILRALRFDDEWVKRQYIVSNNIEQTLLMEDRAEADALMFNNKPRNVRYCYTKTLEMIGSSHGMRTHSMEPYQGLPWLTQDIQPAIRAKEDQLKQAIAEEKSLGQEIRGLDRKITDLHGRITEKKNEKYDAERHSRRLDSRIQHLKELLQEDNSLSMSALQTEKAEIDDFIKVLISKLRNSTAEKGQITDQLAELNERIEMLEQEHEASDARGIRLQDELNNMGNEQTRLQGLLMKSKKQLEDQKANVGMARVDLKKQETMCKEWTAQAMTEYPERVTPKETPEELQKKIAHLEVQVKEREKIVGVSVEKMEEKMKDTLLQWNEAKKSLSEIDFLIKGMHRALVSRTAKWNLFRMYISLSAKSHFTYYMHKRGDSGTLTFEHKTERLIIRVATGDQFRDGSRKKDAKTLSGGEKSFSQVSLLLALWQGIASPVLW